MVITVITNCKTNQNRNTTGSKRFHLSLWEVSAGLQGIHLWSFRWLWFYCFLCLDLPFLLVQISFLFPKKHSIFFFGQGSHFWYLECFSFFYVISGLKKEWSSGSRICFALLVAGYTGYTGYTSYINMFIVNIVNPPWWKSHDFVTRCNFTTLLPDSSGALNWRTGCSLQPWLLHDDHFIGFQPSIYWDILGYFCEYHWQMSCLMNDENSGGYFLPNILGPIMKHEKMSHGKKMWHQFASKIPWNPPENFMHIPILSDSIPFFRWVLNIF